MALGDRSNEHVRGELGQRVRTLRRSRGFTQAQLAERAGLSRPTLSTMERGNDVSLDSFLSILRALDLLDALSLAFPEPGVSPISELNESAGSRASRRSTSSGSTTWTWGDQQAGSS